MAWIQREALSLALGPFLAPWTHAHLWRGVLASYAHVKKQDRKGGDNTGCQHALGSKCRPRSLSVEEAGLALPSDLPRGLEEHTAAEGAM